MLDLRRRENNPFERGPRRLRAGRNMYLGDEEVWPDPVKELPARNVGKISLRLSPDWRSVGQSFEENTEVSATANRKGRASRHKKAPLWERGFSMYRARV